MAKRRYEEVDEFQEDAEDAEENAEEDAELEPEQNAAEDGEANEDERYWGFISSVKDDRMWVTCEQVPPEFAHRDPKITRKSKAPAGLELGSWISFDLLDEWPGENWGSLLVINIEPCEPPDDWDKEEALAAVEAKERAARRDRGSKEPRNNKANQWSQAKANGHANGRNGQGRVPPAAQALTSRSQPAAKRPGQAAVPPAGGLSKSSAVAAFREATRAGRAFSSGWSAPKKQATQVSNWKRPRKQEAVPADLAPFEKAFLAAPESLSEEERQSMMESRETLEIRVEMPDELADVFPPISGFDDLRGILPDYAFEGIAAMGIETPMPIQAQALPLALAGLDVVGVAKTGSGKTLAYLLPALTHIEVQEPLQHGVAAPIALILAPTRELAVQIADMSRAVVDSTTGSVHPNGLAAGVLYGGGHGSKGWQVADIRNGAHIVAATPGRLLDVMDSGEVSLERVTYFVLDEADRMLECGFEDQVGRIGKTVRQDRQTLFFSATWPTTVQQMAQVMCSSDLPPVCVMAGQRGDREGPVSREDILQEVVVFEQGTWEERDKAKQELLYAHLREVLASDEHKILVFVSRKNLADTLSKRLQSEGFKANVMHGGKSQESRLNTLEDFRTGKTKLLVTTDVMGRGLDIPGISHVVIFDMGDIDDYVHRIGRTARGPYGKGHALTFFEYDKKWPNLPRQLLQVLETSGQEVPRDLKALAVGSGRAGRVAKGGWR